MSTRKLRKPRDEAGFGLVEAMIALIMLAIGLMAITGLAMTVASQTRLAAWQTDQALAGQEALERIHRGGYAAAVSGVDTITLGGNTYFVTLTVTNPSARVKQVDAVVPGVGTLQARSFSTRLYQPRPLPGPP
ncbi:MAG: hypothetical protein ACE5JR_08380 [Gemmatimonadota bacterium]